MAGQVVRNLRCVPFPRAAFCRQLPLHAAGGRFGMCRGLSAYLPRRQIRLNFPRRDSGPGRDCRYRGQPRLHRRFLGQLITAHRREDLVFFARNAIELKPAIRPQLHRLYIPGFLRCDTDSHAAGDRRGVNRRACLAGETSVGTRRNDRQTLSAPRGGCGEPLGHGYKRMDTDRQAMCIFICVHRSASVAGSCFSFPAMVQLRSIWTHRISDIIVERWACQRLISALKQPARE